MKQQAIWLAGVAALLPAVAVTATAQASVEAGVAQFAPPASLLTLSRTVYRTLSDGKQVIVTRRYAIRFSSDGDGFRLDGEFIDVNVQAPPVLANLAEIERRRQDTAMFPAQLDSNGFLRDASGPPIPDARQKAALAAGSLIARSTLPNETKREADGYLGQITAASKGSAWPVDLFNPGPAERVNRRKVTLADGSQGEVEVRIHAEGLMPGGLARKVERTVITRLGGTERTTREVWTIAS